MSMAGFNQLLKHSKDAGINVKKEYDTGIELCQALGQLPFYCGDDTLHIRNENYVVDFEGDGCCETHRVGLPRHPATGEEMALTPYQVEFCNRVIQAILGDSCDVSKKLIKLKKEYLRKAHKFHINKGRQMGFTEIVLRLIQYFCFNRYAGYNVGIMAATSGSLAKKDLRRFALLFKHIKITVVGWERGMVLLLKNGVVVEAFKASEEAMTGDTNYKCIFMDEAAKWKLTDDRPVFNSIMPIVGSGGADLFLVSTPKGPLKMFYKIFKKPKDFIKMKFDIWRTKGNLYTEQEIIDKIRYAQEDPNQEYLCEFTIGEGSIFGNITDDDRASFSEWTVEDEDEDESEDDSYIETEEFLFTNEDKKTL